MKNAQRSSGIKAGTFIPYTNRANDEGGHDSDEDNHENDTNQNENGITSAGDARKPEPPQNELSPNKITESGSITNNSNSYKSKVVPVRSVSVHSESEDESHVLSPQSVDSSVLHGTDSTNPRIRASLAALGDGSFPQTLLSPPSAEDDERRPLLESVGTTIPQYDSDNKNYVLVEIISAIGLSYPSLSHRTTGLPDVSVHVSQGSEKVHQTTAVKRWYVSIDVLLTLSEFVVASIVTDEPHPVSATCMHTHTHTHTEFVSDVSILDNAMQQKYW